MTSKYNKEKRIVSLDNSKLKSMQPLIEGLYYSIERKPVSYFKGVVNRGNINLSLPSDRNMISFIG